MTASGERGLQHVGRVDRPFGRPGAYERYQETQDFSHLGTRCEIKNMNSMRFIQQAIEYEARRQIGREGLLDGARQLARDVLQHQPSPVEEQAGRAVAAEPQRFGLGACDLEWLYPTGQESP